MIFIIASIWLFFIAPKIAIISLVIGGLLFIGAIGFNKFRSRLCFNKSQIENYDLEQNQNSIDERTNNLQAKQMPSNNEINNDNPNRHPLNDSQTIVVNADGRNHRLPVAELESLLGGHKSQYVLLRIDRSFTHEGISSFWINN